MSSPLELDLLRPHNGSKPQRNAGEIVRGRRSNWRELLAVEVRSKNNLT